MLIVLSTLLTKKTGTTVSHELSRISSMFFSIDIIFILECFKAFWERI